MVVFLSSRDRTVAIACGAGNAAAPYRVDFAGLPIWFRIGAFSKH
jgi:hypothetical protein